MFGNFKERLFSHEILKKSGCLLSTHSLHCQSLGPLLFMNHSLRRYLTPGLKLYLLKIALPLMSCCWIQNLLGLTPQEVIQKFIQTQAPQLQYISPWGRATPQAPHYADLDTQIYSNLKALEQIGRPIDLKNYVKATDPKTEFTLLHWAAIAPFPKTMSWLIEVHKEQKISLDYLDAWQCTPLYHAAQRGHTPILNALIAAGADASRSNQYQVTPLQIAAQNGHIQAVDQLIKAKALEAEKQHEHYSWNLSLLKRAFIDNYWEIAALLIESGAPTDSIDLDTCDKWGTTWRERILKSGNQKAIDVLRKKEATAT